MVVVEVSRGRARLQLGEGPSWHEDISPAHTVLYLYAEAWRIDQDTTDECSHCTQLLLRSTAAAASSVYY